MLIDEFNDGNDDGWTRVDSTAGQSYGPGTFSASTNEYRLEGGGIIHDDVPGGGFLASFWDASADARFADGFLRATVRAETEGSIASLGLRLTGSLQTGFDGYLFIGSTATFFPQGQETNGGFLINRIENSRNVQTWNLDPSFSFGVDEDWNLEAGAVDDMLSLKVWRLGDPEPEVPQFVVFDANFDEGSFGVESNIHEEPFGGPARVSAIFDDVYFTFPGEKGDFNHDDDLDVDDLSVLIRQIRGDESIYVDLTDDGLVNAEDLNTWVKELFNTWIGDANLDGEFNSGDLVAVFQAGEYEDIDVLNSGWATGDWDGDGEFTSSDLVAAFQDGGYEQGPRPTVNPVPEPTSGMMTIAGIICISIMSRTRWPLPVACISSSTSQCA